jgi:hypothetical protein
VMSEKNEEQDGFEFHVIQQIFRMSDKNVK